MRRRKKGTGIRRLCEERYTQADYGEFHRTATKAQTSTTEVMVTYTESPIELR